MRGRIAGIMLATLIAWMISEAQVPRRITYQGRLLNGTNLVNGSVALAFRLYTTPAGGTALYGQTGAVSVVDGLYATELGDASPAFLAAFTNEPLYLEAQVDGVTLTPREVVRSVAYALRAAGVSTGAITAAMIANGAVGSAQLAAGSVVAGTLGPGAVSSTNLAAGSVGAAAIQNGSILDADLAAAYWRLDGSNNVDASSFIGHFGQEPLIFRLFGQRVMRYQYGSLSHSVVGGHESNSVKDLVYGSVIAGGGTATQPNKAHDDYSTIGGGAGNVAGGDNVDYDAESFASVGGGQSNRAEALGSTVAGGVHNLAQGDHAAVGGGERNQALSDNTVVAGGFSNVAFGAAAVVGGGFGNAAEASYTVVAGGTLNRAEEFGAAIAGGQRNQAIQLFAFVGGGLFNRSDALYGSILGGEGNWVINNGTHGVIAGGYSNVVSDTRGVVAGGAFNRANNYSVVGGGYSNEAYGGYAVVGGGLGNSAAGDSFVGGGQKNRASDSFSVVPGGLENEARAPGSFAAGRRAVVNSVDAGTFLWADSSSTSRFFSAAINEVGLRAASGLRLALNSPGAGNNERFGRIFRDNTIVAWAKVTAAGSAGDNAFGIAAITNTAAGLYEIELTATATNASQLVMVASPELDAQPTSAATMRFATVNQLGPTSFQIFINSGTFAPINNDFTVIATGR